MINYFSKADKLYDNEEFSKFYNKMNETRGHGELQNDAISGKLDKEFKVWLRSKKIKKLKIC